MIRDHNGHQDHERFRELTALAGSGAIASREWLELKPHLQACSECREAYSQYLVLSREGIPTLAAAYADQQEPGIWDDAPSRGKLLARVRAAEQRPAFEIDDHSPGVVQSHLMRRIAVNAFAQAAVAACLIATVGFGAYRLGSRAQQTAAAVVPAAASHDDEFQKLSTEKHSVDALLAAQAKKLAQLQQEASQKEQELVRLRAALRALGDHSDQLVAANSQSEGQLQSVSQQRDTLNAQLQDANQTYQNVRAELASLRSERDKAQLHTASLEAKIAELNTVNRDQERRLKDSEQYLAADRDVRELMGARRLYIADVFDVDGTSRTKKPYGRVFYTQGKSLIFYAFDLDRQPGVVNASTFQVWGQKETAQGERALPLNLGILYMDNESNRRWVMHFDDPRELAKIDAVFVTVEPRGGSQKPTSKPLLYALLRNEVNHP